MMDLKQAKEQYRRIPVAVRTFLFRATLLFVGWQLLYNLVLLPVRVPDRPLTNFTAYSTAKVLSLFYNHITPVYIIANERKDALILMDGRKIVGIADPCNALDIYVLYIAFLLCFPGTARRRLIFMAWGLPAIYAFNIIRSAIITWMNVAHNGWADFSHHYVFTTLMYLLVFYAWVLYTKKEVHAA